MIIVDSVDSMYFNMRAAFIKNMHDTPKLFVSINFSKHHEQRWLGKAYIIGIVSEEWVQQT